MGYIFGIVLCFTVLAVMKFWKDTAPEREQLRLRKDAELMGRKTSDPEKTCAKGWHTFTRWEDSSYYHNAQQRKCMTCGLRDERTVR